MCQSRPKVYTYTANFKSMCSLSASGGQKSQFWAIFDFLGLLYRPPFTDGGQISSECVHCVGFRWQKKHNFGHILTFGGYRTDPLLPMRVKFGVLGQTQGKGKERKSIYIAVFWARWYTQNAQTWITQFYLLITPCLSFFRARSPDVTTTATEAADIQLQLTTHLSSGRHGMRTETAATDRTD